MTGALQYWVRSAYLLFGCNRKRCKSLLFRFSILDCYGYSLIHLPRTSGFFFFFFHPHSDDFVGKAGLTYTRFRCAVPQLNYHLNKARLKASPLCIFCNEIEARFHRKTALLGFSCGLGFICAHNAAGNKLARRPVSTLKVISLPPNPAVMIQSDRLLLLPIVRTSKSPSLP